MDATHRFSSKVQPDPITGCWVWAGAIQTRGYGSFGPGGRGKSMLAHRWAYEHFIGPVPEGMALDHLCRNRRCVNPRHLEIVTNKVNTLRGISFAAENAKKTHCKRGHELTGSNLGLSQRGKRICLECQKIHNARYVAKRRLVSA